MRLVRLRTSKPNTFWFMDNIHLTPDKEVSPPFDLDKVYKAGKEFIQRSAQMTGRIEIIDATDTREELIKIVPDDSPHYELPGQQHLYVPRPVVISMKDDEVVQNEIEEEPQEREEKPPEIPAEPKAAPALKNMDIPEEFHKRALKLLAEKVGFIEDTISGLSKTADTRLFILACLRAEETRKNRKSVVKFLSERFLMIPPE